MKPSARCLPWYLWILTTQQTALAYKHLFSVFYHLNGHHGNDLKTSVLICEKTETLILWRSDLARIAKVQPFFFFYQRFAACSNTSQEATGWLVLSIHPPAVGQGSLGCWLTLQQLFWFWVVLLFSFRKSRGRGVKVNDSGNSSYLHIHT